jgi:hypothetical protein
MGLHFIDSKAAAAEGHSFVQQEQYELRALYGGARVERGVGEEVGLLIQQRQQRAQQPQYLQAMVATLHQHSECHGRGHKVVSSPHGADDECERELQKEEEEEEEQEQQVQVRHSS